MKQKTEPQEYKICDKCGNEYVSYERDLIDGKIILRHNEKCPICTHKKRR